MHVLVTTIQTGGLWRCKRRRQWHTKAALARRCVSPLRCTAQPDARAAELEWLRTLAVYAKGHIHPSRTTLRGSLAAETRATGAEFS
jgi:hypothetical protein